MPGGLRFGENLREDILRQWLLCQRMTHSTKCSLFTGEAIFLPTGNEALSILYMAVFATCLALSFQNYGEKHLPAAPLSILLSLESVFGVLFSVLFGTERPTIPMLIGFAVIFAAVLISQTKLSFLSPFRKKEETAGE